MAVTNPSIIGFGQTIGYKGSKLKNGGLAAIFVKGMSNLFQYNVLQQIRPILFFRL